MNKPVTLTQGLCPPGSNCSASGGGGGGGTPKYVPKSKLKVGEVCQNTYMCGDGSGKDLVCDYATKKCRAAKESTTESQPLLSDPTNIRRGEANDNGNYFYNDIRIGAIVVANQKRESDIVKREEKMTIRFDNGPGPADSWSDKDWAPCLGGKEDAREDCTWDSEDTNGKVTKNCDALCYMAVSKNQFQDADVTIKNEPAGHVEFKEVACVPRVDLDHGDIFVMQLPWRSADDARKVGRAQLEWCRNWGSDSDCPGNGMYVHNYVGDYEDHLPFDGSDMQRFEFNFNTGTGTNCKKSDSGPLTFQKDGNTLDKVSAFAVDDHKHEVKDKDGQLVHKIFTTDGDFWNIQSAGQLTAKKFCDQHNGCPDATFTLGGMTLNPGAMQYLKTYEDPKLENIQFQENDYFLKLWINNSCVQGVNFNADMWQPAGQLQLSGGDDPFGVWLKKNLANKMFGYLH